MNIGLNGNPLLIWTRPSCWSREKLRYNLLSGLLVIVGLIVLGFSFTALIYFIYTSTGNPITWIQAFSVGLTQWWTWLLLYSLVFWLTRRFPIERKRWRQGAIFFSLISVVIVAVKLGLDVALIRLVYEGEVFNRIPERSLLAMMLYFNVLTWGTFVGVGHALNFYRQMRERELKASQLEAQLAQAQLQSLKMQLQPHFLFNTLHTIAMLNLKDPKAANRMLSRLSDLLRLSLESVGVQEVTLKQELDFLKQYLEIQQIRFQDRLRVHFEIEPESLDAQVPNLILQPIVENAIRHGIADQETNARIEIQATRRNGWLDLRVLDNGPGIPADALAELNPGVGLKNTRARLDQIFGPTHRFELKNIDGASGGGLEVVIAIPFREEKPSGEI